MSVYSTYLLPIILYILYITTYTLPIYYLYDTVANRSTPLMYYTHTHYHTAPMYTTYLDAPAIIYSPHSISHTNPKPQGDWEDTLGIPEYPDCANLTLGQLRKAQVNGFSVDVHLGCSKRLRMKKR